MKKYTIIGYWPDTNQRFLTHIEAECAKSAEEIVIIENPGVFICGTINGTYVSAENNIYVNDSGFADHMNSRDQRV